MYIPDKFYHTTVLNSWQNRSLGNSVPDIDEYVYQSYGKYYKAYNVITKYFYKHIGSYFDYTT